MKILIMGLSGAGKTTLARKLIEKLPNSTYYNGDTIRSLYNDWDFSDEGRLRQGIRMKSLADESKSKYVICDFIAPTAKIRNLFNADFTVFVDTCLFCKYQNTNQIFQPPITYNVRVSTQDAEFWSNHIRDILLSYCVNNENKLRIYEKDNFNQRWYGESNMRYSGVRAVYY
jgi:adenylylsulfate kinase